MEKFFKSDNFKRELCLAEISSNLITNFIGNRLIYKFCVDSTNNVAKRYISNGLAKSGDIFLADEQTRGRGRKGSRVWESKKMENIYLSLLISNSIFSSPIVTLIVGITVTETLKEITSLDVKVKWPNDVYINGKKVSGVLCETVNFGSSDSLIIGIGVNVNTSSFSDKIKNSSTSMYLEKGDYFSREKVISEILNRLEFYILKYNSSVGDFIKKYKTSCISINRKVLFYDEKGICRYGKVVDISDVGQLIVIADNNDVISVSSSCKVRHLGNEDYF